MFGIFSNSNNVKQCVSHECWVCLSRTFDHITAIKKHLPKKFGIYNSNAKFQKKIYLRFYLTVYHAIYCFIMHDLLFNYLVNIRITVQSGNLSGAVWTFCGQGQV